MTAQATGVEKFMLAALAAELHQHVGSNPQALLASARSIFADSAIQCSALCRLTLTLLDDVFGTPNTYSPPIHVNTDIADAVVLEPGVKWWMIRLAIRLLIAKYRRATASYDRRGALQSAEVAINLGQHVPTLREEELFNLRLLTARVDWMVRGSTPRMEAALIGNYQTASANGALSEVVHIGSLLASMMIISGKGGSEDYAQTALALANTLPEGRTTCFAHLNLAVANLDVGRPDDAAQVLADVTPLTKKNVHDVDIDDLRAEYDLLAREVRVTGSSSLATLPFENRGEIGASTGGDPLRGAYCARVLALELECRGEHREAVRQISKAWEIAACRGDWMAHRTIRRTYDRLTR